VILQSFKYPFTDYSHVKSDLPVSLAITGADLLHRYKLVPLGPSVGYVQTISNNVVQASPRLVPNLISHVFHHSGHDVFLCGHKSIVACTSQLHLVVGHVAF
jgi:hypothetical protein